VSRILLQKKLRGITAIKLGNLIKGYFFDLSASRPPHLEIE
jgi:hypothetical protein